MLSTGHCSSPVTSDVSFVALLASCYTVGECSTRGWRDAGPPSVYSDSRLSHDLDALTFFLKIMWSRFLAEMQDTLRGSSAPLDFSFSARCGFRRSCVTRPTKSSSMLWLRTADTSLCLQPNFRHAVRGSVTAERVGKSTAAAARASCCQL